MFWSVGATQQCLFFLGLEVFESRSQCGISTPRVGKTVPSGLRSVSRKLANLVFWSTKVASGIGCPLLPDIFVEVPKLGTTRKAKLTSSSPFQSSFT